MSPCLSKRGWIATARHSEFTLVDDSHRVFRQLWDRFWKFFGCHRTISSPRSFAAFIFAQVTIFPKNSLKVDSIFSAKALVFHSHFPPKRLWLFHDFSTICQHFPSIFQPFFVVPRSTVAPPTGVAPRRGPRQGPGKGRRSRPSGRGVSADSLGGASGGPLGMAWLEGDFHPILFVFFKNFGI